MPIMANPTRYRVEFCERAHNLCLLGHGNRDLAAAFGVSEPTIDNWLAKHYEFRLAVEEGRDPADAKVARALYQRATGYSHPDTHIATWRGVVIKTETVKHYPPDTAAAAQWLAVRRRGKEPLAWQQRQETHHSGDATGGLAEQLARALDRVDGIKEDDSD